LQGTIDTHPVNAYKKGAHYKESSMKYLAIVLLLVSVSAHAMLAFLEREVESGIHRICYYDNAGSEVAITVPITNLCPLTITL
jgi:hypothetical protein